jgi:Putative DNA-binding domain
MTHPKTNMSLADVQQWMQYLLLSQSNALQEHQQHLIPEGEAPLLTDIVKDSKRLSAREHLRIYQRSYTARLRDCMSKQFSALEYALGEELFRAFADEYLQCHPSTNYNLITLGEKFPDWLAANRPDKDETLKEDWPDFMIELARFEYAINIIFEEAANENYILATDDTPEETWQLIPVFHVFAFSFPIRWYYHAFTHKREPELPLPAESYCVVLRHQYKLSMADLTREQYLFLQHLISGCTIREAQAQLFAQNTVTPDQWDVLWPVWKRKWMGAGFFMSSLVLAK